MIWIFVFVSVVAMCAALVAQLILPPERRTRIIFAAASGPSSVFALILLISSYFFEFEDELHRAVTIAFWFIAFMFVGIISAIVGTELASLSQWLRARKSKQR